MISITVDSLALCEDLRGYIHVVWLYTVTVTVVDDVNLKFLFFIFYFFYRVLSTGRKPFFARGVAYSVHDMVHTVQ